MRKAIIELSIICKLGEEHFGIWDELTPEQQAVFANHATDCDAGGDRPSTLEQGQERKKVYR